MTKLVQIQQPPIDVHENPVNFLQGEFDALIWEKGYRVIYEKSLQCPCKSLRTNQQSNCRNCGGTGWIFINPIETRMVLHSMNMNTQFKEWSKESLGFVNISSMNKDRLSFMDRLTLIESESEYNEVRHFKKSQNDTLFVYCSYHIKSILYVGMFVDENTKLRRLDSSEYSFDGNKLFLKPSFNSNFVNENTYSISVRYIHQPQFLIQDINREVMNSRVSVNKKEQVINMPLSAVGRRAHYILDVENIQNDRLLDNSYQDPSCEAIIKTVDSFSKMC